MTDTPIPGPIDMFWPTLTEIEATTMHALHDRLTDSASEVGLVDIAYCELDTPVGRLLLAATETGLLRVAFDLEDHGTVLADLADRISPRILEAPDRLDAASRELDEYFAGRRQSFDLPLDRRLSRGYRQEVQTQLIQIPYGQTQTYAQVAAATGRPLAVRAVGTACATNPLPIVVPCHRVRRSGGGLGGYLGGLEAKATLLDLEAAGAGAGGAEVRPG